MNHNFISNGKSDHVIKNGMCLFFRSWLSNWTTSPMLIDDVNYSCVEQYMMSMKARRFGDFEALHGIMNTSNPKEQKAIGRLVKNFNSELWDDISFEIVTRGTIEKYRQNPKLLIKLQQIGNVEFAEASPYDTIWGIGLSSDNPDAFDKSKWIGKNLLGLAINKAKELIEKLEEHGISVGGGIHLIWRSDTSVKFIIDMNRI